MNQNLIANAHLVTTSVWYNCGVIGFEPLSGQTKDYKKPETIKLVFVASPLSTHHRGVRAKTS